MLENYLKVLPNFDRDTLLLLKTILQPSKTVHTTKIFLADYDDVFMSMFPIRRKEMKGNGLEIS